MPTSVDVGADRQLHAQGSKRRLWRVLPKTSKLDERNIFRPEVLKVQLRNSQRRAARLWRRASKRLAPDKGYATSCLTPRTRAAMSIDRYSSLCTRRFSRQRRTDSRSRRTSPSCMRFVWPLRHRISPLRIAPNSDGNSPSIKRHLFNATARFELWVTAIT